MLICSPSHPPPPSGTLGGCCTDTPMRGLICHGLRRVGVSSINQTERVDYSEATTSSLPCKARNQTQRHRYRRVMPRLDLTRWAWYANIWLRTAACWVFLCVERQMSLICVFGTFFARPCWLGKAIGYAPFINPVPPDSCKWFIYVNKDSRRLVTWQPAFFCFYFVLDYRTLE